MRRNGRSRFVEPGVPIGVIHVPMGIDEPGDRVGTQPIEGGHNSRPRDRKPGVDQELAILAGEDRDISTGAHKNADVPAEGANLDLSLRGRLDHRRDNARLLRKQWARAQDQGAGATACRNEMASSAHSFSCFQSDDLPAASYATLKPLWSLCEPSLETTTSRS